MSPRYLGYDARRRDLNVYTNSGLATRWAIEDYGVIDETAWPPIHKLALRALDTEVPGMPEDPGPEQYWRHRALLLVMRNNLPCLSGVGIIQRWDPKKRLPEVQIEDRFGYWIARTVDAATGTVRLESVSHPGWYLSHKRTEQGTLEEEAALTVNYSVDYHGHDLDWILTPIAG